MIYLIVETKHVNYYIFKLYYKWELPSKKTLGRGGLMLVRRLQCRVGIGSASSVCWVV